MRVIAGIAKGRSLKVLKGSTTRPTTDRVKESLFNIIQPLVPGARFLDLFAGTGSIGIEALSRGAKFCLFVEKDEKAVRVIRENLAVTGLERLAQVRRADAFGFVAQAGLDGDEPFDIVFADPPYSQGFSLRMLKAAGTSGIMHRESLLIIEHRAGDELPDAVEGRDGMNLVRADLRHYGDTLISFYRFETGDGSMSHT